MKKMFIICVILCVCLIFASLNNGFYYLAKKNMSDLRTTFFEGASDDYYCNISCGTREEEYVYNGIKTKSVDCSVVSIIFNIAMQEKTIEFDVFIDDTQITGLAEISPYENVYMCDLKTKISGTSNVFLQPKGTYLKTKLCCISSTWKISYNKAIKIGANYLKQTILNLYYNKKLNAECYLLTLANKYFKQKFWYFSVIDTSGNINNCIIDTTTGKVMAVSSLKWRHKTQNIDILSKPDYT